MNFKALFSGIFLLFFVSVEKASATPPLVPCAPSGSTISNGLPLPLCPVLTPPTVVLMVPNPVPVLPEPQVTVPMEVPFIFDDLSPVSFNAGGKFTCTVNAKASCYMAKKVIEGSTKGDSYSRDIAAASLEAAEKRWDKITEGTLASEEPGELMLELKALHAPRCKLDYGDGAYVGVHLYSQQCKKASEPM